MPRLCDDGHVRRLSAWMSAVADMVRTVNAAEPLEDLLARIAERGGG
ncbi:hypothetical protein SAMN05443637_1066 [Pseudonocardia thermophila]|uniref:Uncharacterized protein n=1 Tax=Pseudonocardia thermophila TaxID=1848 RepID=A0A1M6S9A5_PSETH|nr:hypothetical protein SAMN05443637_1066 [Pseudonocardia thermophila]